MTVKEIFALRKQGKIEEAYEAIRPIYREHKGKFTTLCMFWVASDVFKLRLEQKRVEEAEKIYKALHRLIPSIEDDERHSAANFMHYAEGRLIKASEKFRKRYFAIRDKKKHEIAENEGINIPSDNPLKGLNPSDPCSQGVERFSDRFSSDFEAQRPTNEKETFCEIRDIRVTDKPAASDISAFSALSAGQTKVLDCIKAHPGLKVPGLEAETGIPAKSIERHIKVLIERKLIEHRGSKKTGGYHSL